MLGMIMLDAEDARPDLSSAVPWLSDELTR